MLTGRRSQEQDKESSLVSPRRRDLPITPSQENLVVIELLTGNCPLRYNLRKMNLMEPPCCLCLEEEITAAHIL